MKDDDDTTEVLAALLEEPPRSAYIHLPFCRARCSYCDFAVVSGKSATAPTTHRKYVDGVIREIRSTAQAVGARVGAGRRGGGDSSVVVPPERLDTVYFGGGTPSLVTPSLVAEMMHELDVAFGVSTDAEVTMELDPGTFDGRSLNDYRVLAGVTRASIGVQSLDDRDVEM